MTPEEFIASSRWRHTRDEVHLEILAVCLPILVYLVALLAAEFGLSRADNQVDHAKLSHFMVIPDALFGACILFAFSAIHGYRRGGFPDDLTNAAYDAICRWRVIGLAGLVACALLSGLAVIFHLSWALPVGLGFMYVGGLAYKKVIFHRTFLTAETNTFRH